MNVPVSFATRPIRRSSLDTVHQFGITDYAQDALGDVGSCHAARGGRRVRGGDAREV